MLPLNLKLSQVAISDNRLDQFLHTKSGHFKPSSGYLYGLQRKRIQFLMNFLSREIQRHKLDLEDEKSMVREKSLLNLTGIIQESVRLGFCSMLTMAPNTTVFEN